MSTDKRERVEYILKPFVKENSRLEMSLVFLPYRLYRISRTPNKIFPTKSGEWQSLYSFKWNLKVSFLDHPEDLHFENFRTPTPPWILNGEGTSKIESLIQTWRPLISQTTRKTGTEVLDEDESHSILRDVETEKEVKRPFVKRATEVKVLLRFSLKQRIK